MPRDRLEDSGAVLTPGGHKSQTLTLKSPIWGLLLKNGISFTVSRPRLFCPPRHGHSSLGESRGDAARPLSSRLGGGFSQNPEVTPMRLSHFDSGTSTTWKRRCRCSQGQRDAFRPSTPRRSCTDQDAPATGDRWPGTGRPARPRARGSVFSGHGYLTPRL